MITWGNIIGIAVKKNKKVWTCMKCKNELGSTDQDWKTYAMKHIAPLSKAQPTELANETERFMLREYYCPYCGVMFEVLNLDTIQPNIVTFKLDAQL
jgi:acetone carboxylase gamma subunit